MKVYSSISELVGHTPLVQLQRFAAVRGLKANLLAKVEYFNPAGSVKDRIACAMLDDAEQRGLHGQLTAGRLHLPRAHDLCEQRTDFVLPGFTGANAGAESQPSLGERRQQREFALVGARKLKEIRRKHERAELIFPSGGTNFVQFLTGGEEHIAVRALVGVVGDGERNVARVHRDDLQLRVPVIGDEIAVIGLAAVQRGVDLERERQCAVLFFLSAGCIHGENPFLCTRCVHTLKSCYYC